MNSQSTIEERAQLLKVIADATRLRILGLLAEESRSGKELAEALDLTAPTISHHMRRLTSAGIVSEVRDAQRHVYSLNADLLGSLQKGEVAPAHDTPLDDRARVMKHFFRDGRLVTIPAARKQRVIVLQYMLEQFDPNRTYPEREVNDLLGGFHEDFATLRRELVDYGYLVREKGIYQVARRLPKRSSNLEQELPVNEADWLRALIKASVNKD